MPKVYTHAVAIRYLTLCAIWTIHIHLQNRSRCYTKSITAQDAFQPQRRINVSSGLSNWQNTDYFWREKFSPNNSQWVKAIYSRQVPNCSLLSIGETLKVYSQSMKEIPTFQEHHKILILYCTTFPEHSHVSQCCEALTYEQLKINSPSSRPYIY